MAKFVRRNKRRTFKKRRFSRKKRFTRRSTLPKYDGMIRLKLQATKELDNTDISGISNLVVEWGDQIAAPVTDVIRIRDCQEWVRFKNVYRFFRVQGVRMDYHPYGFSAGSTNIASEELLVGSNVVDGALTSGNIRLAVDFKAARANQRMVKYVGVAKSKKRSGGASEAGVPLSTALWHDVDSASNYHNGKTNFIVQNLGLPADQAAGVMYVTYYIWFKTQRTDT